MWHSQKKMWCSHFLQENLMEEHTWPASSCCPVDLPWHSLQGHSSSGLLPDSDWAQGLSKADPFQFSVGLFYQVLWLRDFPSAWLTLSELVHNLKLFLLSPSSLFPFHSCQIYIMVWRLPLHVAPSLFILHW